MKRSTSYLGLIATHLVLGAALASAQNMVGNGEFDSNVNGWTPYGVVIDWDTSDYLQSPTSGSGRITNDADGILSSGTVYCVSGIVVGESYDLGAWVRVPSGQTGSGRARLGLYWRTGSNCSGSQISVPDSPSVYVSNGWTLLTVPQLVAPAGVVSAEVTLFNAKTSAVPGEYQTYFDGVFLGDFGWVFTDGFEDGTLSSWSQAVP